MKLFLDRNLSPALLPLLNGMGFVSDHHDSVFSATTEDPVILEYVANNDYVLVTYDHQIRKKYPSVLRQYSPRILFLTSTIRLKNIEDQKRWFLTTGFRVLSKLTVPPMTQLGIGVNGEVRTIWEPSPAESDKTNEE